jgi:hypothetical protein
MFMPHLPPHFCAKIYRKLHLLSLEEDWKAGKWGQTLEVDWKRGELQERAGKTRGKF